MKHVLLSSVAGAMLAVLTSSAGAQSIVSWGDDSLGQVANTPSGTGFVRMAAGSYHSLALGDPQHVATYCTAGFSASGCTATMFASGTASASASTGFILMASTVEGSKDGLFFFGTNGGQANPWGSGTSYQCVVPPVKRAGMLAGSGTTGQCDGSFSQDHNALWCPTCPKPQKNPGAGAIVEAQLWYRDPFNTSNQTTSLSNAVEFMVLP